MCYPVPEAIVDQIIEALHVPDTDKAISLLIRNSHLTMSLSAWFVLQNRQLEAVEFKAALASLIKEFEDMQPIRL